MRKELPGGAGTGPGGPGGGRLTAPWQADEGEGTERKLWSMVNKGPYLAVQVAW
jgi:hypothetical protein